MTDILTMGGGVTLGFVFDYLSTRAMEKHDRKMIRHEAYEKSKDSAAKRVGGWVRRGIYAIVAFSFVVIPLSGLLDKNVVLEYELDRKFLFWEWTIVRLKEVHGVVFIEENRTAFLALISFYFGRNP